MIRVRRRQLVAAGRGLPHPARWVWRKITEEPVLLGNLAIQTFGWRYPRASLAASGLFTTAVAIVQRWLSEPEVKVDAARQVAHAQGAAETRFMAAAEHASGG